MLGAYNCRPVVTRTRREPPAVYRSGQLFLSTPRARTLMATLGITLVIDLRSPATAAAFPDRPVPGARRVLVDVLGNDDVAALVGADLMNARYRQMVVNPGQRRRVATVLRLIADHDGASLMHCTDGKDRTGWIAALLQHVGGDDEAAVREAYLASGKAIRLMTWARYVGDLVSGGPARARERRPVNLVRAAYLGAALDAVGERYGTLDAYVRDGLGLDDATVQRLWAKVA